MDSEYTPEINDVLSQSDKTLKELVEAQLTVQQQMVTPAKSTSVQIADAPKNPNRVIDEDFNNARENLSELIKKGGTTLTNLLILAAASDHPRAYEVATQLIATLSTLNQDMLAMHKQHRELTERKAGEGSSVQNITNNTLLVGGTDDALEMLKKLKEREAVTGIVIEGESK